MAEKAVPAAARVARVGGRGRVAKKEEILATPSYAIPKGRSEMLADFGASTGSGERTMGGGANDMVAGVSRWRMVGRIAVVDVVVRREEGGGAARNLKRVFRFSDLLEAHRKRHRR